MNNQNNMQQQFLADVNRPINIVSSGTNSLRQQQFQASNRQLISTQSPLILKRSVQLRTILPSGINQLNNSSSSDANLSPPISVNLNDFKNYFTSINSVKMPLSNNSGQISESNSLDCDKLKQVDKITKKLGNYILFETQSQNDSYATAFNTQTNTFFYWKRFNKSDYMKKLEPYFIMEFSKRIYKFSELIFDQPSNKTDLNQEQYVYAIFEQNFGDLHTYMKEKKRLNEPEAKHIFRQCVKAIRDCHENGIIVRDIKLKKFVFIDREKTKIALTNLEDCLLLDEDATDDLIKSQQGCPAYVSPEVLSPQQTSYSGKLSDSWSLGVVLFTLLLGRYPFHHQNITILFAKIARAKFQLPPSNGLSLDAKILLRSLIRLKPEERLTASEILSSNWLKKSEFYYQELQQNQTNISFSHVNSVSTAVNYLNNLNYSTTNLIVNNTNNNSNILNPNTICAHKPLGISLSAPNRVFSSLAGANLAKSTNEKNTKEDSDRLVPETESNSKTSNQPIV